MYLEIQTINIILVAISTPEDLNYLLLLFSYHFLLLLNMLSLCFVIISINLWLTGHIVNFHHP